MKKRFTLLGLAAVAAMIAGMLAVQIASADTPPSTMSAITPCRLLDTRLANPIGEHPGPLTAGETATLAVVGEHGQCNVPEGTNAITGTVTILGVDATSFLTIFPADEAQPNASNINWVAGRPTTANQFVVELSTDDPAGAMKIYNQDGAVDVLIDINSRYQPGGGSTLPTAGNWGVVDRNTVGSPNAELRSGPSTPAGQPPFGTGSLGLGAANGESAHFGNEVDFAGDDFSALTALGFQVFNTQENIAQGGAAMPNIRIEVDPNVAGDDDYTTLSFVPDTSAPGWSGYIDATTTGLWGGSGLAGCDIQLPDLDPGGLCTWDELQDLLGDGGDPPSILTVGIARGTSTFPWHGAVDGLRVNDTVYNFEEHGVTTAPAPPDQANVLVSATIPASVTKGVTTEFDARLQNTGTAATDNVIVDFALTLTDLQASDVTLEYQVGATWIPIPLAGTGTVTGSFGPAVGFPLPAGHDITDVFRVTFAGAAPSGTVNTVINVQPVAGGAPLATATYNSELVAAAANVLVSATIPASVTKGVTTEFVARLQNTGTAATDNVIVDFALTLTDLQASDVTLEYQVGATWIPIPLAGTGTVTGSFGPAVGFPLPAGHDITDVFRVTFAGAAPSGTVNTVINVQPVAGGAPLATATYNSELVATP